MNINFALVLVVLAAFTGIVWAIDRLFFAQRRERRALALEASGKQRKAELSELVSNARRESLLVEYCRSFFPVIFIVLLLRSFIAEPFRIPSSSMVPTLLIGDFILVNKFAYGVRLPVINTKIWSNGSPRRGEVVVFRYPGMSPDDPTKGVDYIKRVIGVPGDEITYLAKTLYINGEQVVQDTTDNYREVGAGCEPAGCFLKIEHLPGATHQILQRPEINYGPAREGTWRVPEGSYFVMGDNRDNSLDSRAWGMVPEENLVGKAFLVWMNWDSIGGGINLSRIGTTIE